MPWTAYAQTNYMPDQIMKQKETYAAIVDKLQHLKNWLHKHYEAEADAEIHEVEQCGGDIRKMSQPRVSKDLRPGNEDLYVALDKKETRPKVRPAGSEFDGGNSLTCQWCRESESMERHKYALSQDEGTSLDMRIPSPQPIDKSKVAGAVPVKKKTISMEEYHARGQRQWAEEECIEAECKQKEKEETRRRQEEIRQMDQEDLERMARELREQEEKARRTAEEELIWHTLEE